MADDVPRKRIERHAWWKALKGSTLSPQARHVALTLSTYMLADGSRCYPGQDAIAVACGWANERTVRRALTELEEAGYIEVERRAGVRQEGRSGTTHRYWPTIPDGPTNRTHAPARNNDLPDPPARMNDQPTGHQSPEESDDQPDISDGPTGHLRTTNRTPESAKGSSTKGSSTEGPTRAGARVREDSPTDNGHAAGGGDQQQQIENQARRLASKLDINLTRKIRKDLLQALARCLDNGWTVVQLSQHIDRNRTGNIRHPPGWLTDQLKAFAEQPSPRRIRERIDSNVVSLRQALDSHTAEWSRVDQDNAQRRERLDALDPDAYEQLREQAVQALGGSVTPPRQIVETKMLALLDDRDLPPPPAARHQEADA